MKFRTIHGIPPEASEEGEEERLRAILRDQGYRGSGPLPDDLRSAMLVHTNERIDRATSARTLSLQWMLRVAAPGVAAIVAFFIGLHYYTTPAPAERAELTPVLSVLSDAALDSLMDAHAMIDTAAIAGDGQGGLFDISSDGAVEYLLATNHPEVVAETFEASEAEAVLAALAADRNSSF